MFPMLRSIFAGFLIDVGIQLPYFKSKSELAGWIILGFFAFARISIWGSIWVPTCLHFSIKNQPKSILKSIPKCNENLIDFRSQFFMDFWLHLETQVRAMLATFSPQHAPKTHQESIKNYCQLLRQPKCDPDPSGSRPDLDFDAPGPRCCPPGPRFWWPQTSISE